MKALIVKLNKVTSSRPTSIKMPFEALSPQFQSSNIICSFFEHFSYLHKELRS